MQLTKKYAFGFDVQENIKFFEARRLNYEDVHDELSDFFDELTLKSFQKDFGQAAKPTDTKQAGAWHQKFIRKIREFENLDISFHEVVAR
jgi:hypothetical protein